jgi:hypothetical protein
VAGKRRKKQSRARRPVTQASPVARPAAAATAGTEATDEALASTVAPVRAAPRPTPASRYAGSVTAPRRGNTPASSSGTIDIDERVPYFARDLRRIVVTAAIMVILIVGASFLLH